LAFILLFVMAILAIASVWDDSAIMDEASHIPAGYSYIVKQDMRINPEHPPLMKDLAGLGVFIYSKISGDKINFNDTSRYWQNEINSQWAFGFDFLYDIGNNADNIIFWARIPAILIMLILGFYVFKWARELYGNKAGLLALFLYSLSPTVLTHGRFVTTDIPAATGIFIATYYFIKALKNPDRKNIITAGVVLGIALLFKFSTFLLIPFFVLLVIIEIINSYINKDSVNVRSAKSYFASLILVFIIGAIVLYPVYQYHIWNYPAAPKTQEERSAILSIDNCDNLDMEKYPVSQFRDTACILKTYGNRPLVDLVVWMSDKPVLRSYGQYLLGLMMVNQRSIGGNTTYFLGGVSRTGWQSYFPLLYLMKEPIVLHILTLIVLLFALYRLALYKWKYRQLMKGVKWIRVYSTYLKGVVNIISDRIPQTALILFMIIYWGISIKSPLNIGIRHILPVLPMVYVLVSGNLAILGQWIKRFYPRLRFTFHALLFILIIWYFYTNISTFPSYLAYFNEAVGGPENGYKYAVDSNLDWGQDLKRLAKWMEENNIEKIKLDFFGGGNPKYYMGDKIEGWWGSRPESEALGSWLAVSGTFLQGGRGEPVAGYNEPTMFYKWLDKYEPAVVIGHSIFVYDLTKIR
jgi:hypothetical protein